MEAVVASEARVSETVRKEGVGWRRDYIGTPGTINDKPQAFLVERPYAGATIKPHFHDIDQFQVVVQGDGRIGKKEVKPVTFQYADAYTPYGPIVARDDGISFYTLRNVASGGHFSMPGSKHLMPCRAGRNIAGLFDVEAPTPDAGAVERQALMEPQEDGVDALGLRLGPNAETDGPESGAGGQYYLVCRGSLHQEDRVLETASMIRIEPGETPPALRAGDDGADILVLQFGRPSERPGSDPSTMADRDPEGYVVRLEDQKPAR